MPLFYSSSTSSSYERTTSGVISVNGTKSRIAPQHSGKAEGVHQYHKTNQNMYSKHRGLFFASPSFRISIRQSFVAVRHSAFTPSSCSISSECALNRSNISLSLEKYISAPIFFFCVFIVKEMWYIELPTLRRYEP